MLGNVLLYISFALFSAAFLCLLLREFQSLQKNGLASNIKCSSEHIKWLMHIAILSMAVASMLLFYHLLASDFSVYYVWQYTNLDLPLIYKISAFWTGEGGAYLFLTCVISGVSAWMSEKHGFEASAHRKNQLIILLIGLLFLYLTIRHTPFTSIFDVFPDITAIPNDGRGMDPILINFWMIFHPPGIFLGYGLLALTFSTTFISLIEPFDWEPYQRLNSRLAWTALGAGIVSGCLWSYEVWDGYWTWDPAFTSPFMVWLLLTAFLHSSTKYRSEHIFTKQTRALGAFSFILAIYSTYVIHSGDIQSVHAFGEGVQSRLLLYATIMAGVLTLFLLFKTRENPPLRSDLLGVYNSINSIQQERKQVPKISKKSQTLVTNLLSSKSLVTATILLLVALTLIILWGLTFPMMMQMVGTSTTIAISTAIYNDWAYPITLLLLAVIGTCTYSYNTKTRLLALIIAACGTMLFLIIAPFESIHTNLSTPLLAFATISSLLAVAKSAKKRRIYPTSAHMIHLGTAMILIGALMSNYTVSETVLFQSLGETKNVGDYDIRLNDIISPPPQLNEPILGSTKTATYSIYKNGEQVGKGSATFEEHKGEYITHVYTHRSILADVRISYQGIGTTIPIFISVANVKVIPGMSILWSGCILVVFGMLPIILRRNKE